MKKSTYFKDEIFKMTPIFQMGNISNIKCLIYKKFYAYNFEISYCTFCWLLYRVIIRHVICNKILNANLLIDKAKYMKVFNFLLIIIKACTLVIICREK